MSTTQITSMELSSFNTIVLNTDNCFNAVLHLNVNNGNDSIVSPKIDYGKIENLNHIVQANSGNQTENDCRKQQVSSKQTLVLSFPSPKPNTNTFDNALFNFNFNFISNSANLNIASSLTQTHSLNSASAFHFRKIDFELSDGTKFTFFNKLPIELRLKIWRLAAQLPQIIGLKDLEDKKGLCGTNARCPLLLTCWEAHNEVLKRKVDFNSASVSASGGNDSSRIPKIHTNFAVDTLYLTIYRMSIYDRDLPRLWSKLLSGPKEKIRRLAISYSLFKRRWDHMNPMVMKLDLEVLILVVDAEDIGADDVATFVKPRSEVGRRSEFWRTWEGLKTSERRNLQNYKEHYERMWKRNVKFGSTPEILIESGLRDPSKWKVPRILFRDVVNSKNVNLEGKQAAEEDEEIEDEELADDDDDEYSDDEYA